MATEPAWAKVNLCLHVTGRRADGYHLLDSLVVFAGVGDQISVTDSPDLRLCVTGPMASALTGLGPANNLVTRAARLMAARGAALSLEKHLPPASGIGGGSADAAATLRLLARHWQIELPPPEQILTLGADVPACLKSQACRMQGIGDLVTPIGPIAPLWLVLANPGVPVATPDVFRALANRENPGLPMPLPDLSRAEGMLFFLTQTRNDLEAPALAIAPLIGDCLAALRATVGCRLARMSGSGATCFGVFGEELAARAAATAIAAAHPLWWTAAAPILG